MPVCIHTYNFRIKPSIYDTEKRVWYACPLFCFLLYRIIFLTFFMHRFCSVFLSVFWIAVGPFTTVGLLSLLQNSFFLSCYGSPRLSCFSSIVYL